MIAHKTRKSKGGQYALKKLIHSFTARKILELLLTLLIVTFLSFLLVKLSPVDAAEAYARRTDRNRQSGGVVIVEGHILVEYHIINS